MTKWLCKTWKWRHILAQMQVFLNIRYCQIWWHHQNWQLHPTVNDCKSYTKKLTSPCFLADFCVAGYQSVPHDQTQDGLPRSHDAKQWAHVLASFWEWPVGSAWPHAWSRHLTQGQQRSLDSSSTCLRSIPSAQPITSQETEFSGAWPTINHAWGIPLSDRWFSARLQYVQCINNGDTAVLR